MLLVFDIGNTQTVVGVFSGERLIANWRLATERRKTVDEYGMLIKNLFQDGNLAVAQVKAAVISSVVPPVTGLFEEMAVKYFAVKPLVIGPGIKTGLAFKYENPKEVGADRVVNAVAAIKLFGPPLIVVDFGTATTFCAIAPTGEYHGGAIAPGLGISSEALFQRTAKLPRVEIEKPKSIIGKNTIHAMQAGLFYGYLGLVEGIITRMKTEMNCNPRVVATGGLAGLMAENTKMIDQVEPHLTLHGLRFIYELNN
ncbi:MAG: type III pantothenate kinase [Firmicutes bacterium]|nr:type III pantothenate kinase [Bacillota bacterium]